LSAPQDILALIEKRYGDLSPSARAIANYIQQHPIAIISLSLAELASATHTSKATVSRFFRQLGFTSHAQAKETLLALRQAGVPMDTRQPDSDHLQQDNKNLSQTFAALDEDALVRITQQLATASRITLIGFRNAYPAALHFRQQLKQIRSTVRLLPQPGQTLAEDLCDIADDEVIVLLGFRRRSRLFGRIVKALEHRNTVLITDPTGQHYRSQVAELLVCHLDQDAPFDSYAAPMSLIAMLCNRVYRQLGDAARQRTSIISEMYDELQELERK